MPKLLDSDEFFTRVTEHEAEMERDTMDREERRVQREGHAEASYNGRGSKQKERLETTGYEAPIRMP
jgi:hypothetical protein